VEPANVYPIWNLGAKKMNGYAWFLKANLPAFSLDGTLLDERLLQLSTGKLHLPQGLQARRSETESASITVNWQNDPLLKGERLNDELMAVHLSEGKFSASLSTGLQRSHQYGTFNLPSASGPSYLYLFFASADKKDYSGSVCFEV